MPEPAVRRGGVEHRRLPGIFGARLGYRCCVGRGRLLMRLRLLPLLAAQGAGLDRLRTLGLRLRCQLLALLGFGLGRIRSRRPLLRFRGASGRHQIGRHRGAHFRPGGVVLAQEPGDLPALCQPPGALVTGRTIRREGPGGIPRVAQHGLRPHRRGTQGGYQSPEKNDPPESGHQPISPKISRAQL